ncbi:MAG: choice-of-anchor tandem repeat GloVer-containing protein [Alphaproteobacteria bacterium]|jgi:uncharacterized repeat protein (TIGR03803 family)
MHSNRRVLSKLRVAVTSVTAVLITAAFLSGSAQAWTLKTLHSFCAEANCADGSSPLAGLVRDKAGNLYGTTEVGGANGSGVVFELSPNGDQWSYEVLHSFCWTCDDGVGPVASLILDVNGSLYGTTVEKGGANHGCGTVFRLSPNAHRTKWRETLLHVFSCDPFGDQAASTLTYQGKQTGAPYDGTSPLYGTTVSGGTGAGTIYRLVPDGTKWKHKVIYAFCPKGTGGCTDGRSPGSDLIMDDSGTLYGMTGVGGSTNNGIVYQLKSNARNMNWRETILYNFCQLENCTDGALPAGALVMDARGRLFGTSNGPIDAGNIFEMARKEGAWREKPVHIFDPGDCGGYNPAAGLLLDPFATFYGTTAIGGCNAGFGGTVFSFTSKSYSALYTFCSLDHCADGDGPLAPVIRDPFGNLYGTTVLFGANGDGGTVFELSP